MRSGRAYGDLTSVLAPDPRIFFVDWCRTDNSGALSEVNHAIAVMQIKFIFSNLGAIAISGA